MNSKGNQGSVGKAFTWSSLNVFAIAAVDPALAPPARPGRAEVWCVVEIWALNDSGDTVTIPDEEFRRLLKVVNYADGKELPGWAIEFVASPASASAPAATPTSQLFYFWISNESACGTEGAAAASITPTVPNAQAIQTRPAGSNNRFDSWVTLPTAMAPKWKLTTFTLDIASGSDRVYANGLQQIKLKVELAFTDADTGKPGVPTPDELASLTIAFSDTGLALPADAEGATWWVTSPGVPSASDTTHDKGYLPYPEGFALASNARQRDTLAPTASIFSYFYIACASGPVQKTDLCARVRCDDHWIYRTNGIDTDPCDVDHSDGKNSQVTVVGVTPVVPALNQYGWTREVVFGNAVGLDEPQIGRSTAQDAAGKKGEAPPSDASLDPLSVHRYRISLVDKTGAALGIKEAVMTPPGMIQWEDLGTGNQNACYVGYAAPGEDVIAWNETIATGALPKPGLASPDETRVSVMLVGRHDIEEAEAASNGPCILHTTDFYGNPDTLRIKFSPDRGKGRWQLMLGQS